MKKLIMILICMLVMNVFADKKYTHSILKNDKYTYMFTLRDNTCMEPVMKLYDGEVKEVSIARDLFIANIYYTDGYKITINSDNSGVLYDQESAFVERKKLGRKSDGSVIGNLYKCLIGKK